jgi:hypothetical protein
VKNISVWMAASAAVAFSSVADAQNRGRISSTEFNPAISLILDAGLAIYDNDEDYEIAGFPLGGEAGVAEEGFAINEIELVGSADVDDKFYGKITLGIHQDEGETELDIEEAFFQTTALPHGFTVKGGKFFSELGYLNVHHKHAWDFADAPLVYRALLGRQFNDTGLQARWIAPTETFLEVGAEWARGDAFPTGGSPQDGRGSAVLFAHIGGDIGASNSWQLGVSHLQADDVVTELGGHSHGGGDAPDNEFLGDVTISGVDFVYKWAPNGNAKQRNLKIQAEYFVREMDGEFEFEDAANAESGDGNIVADQTGWYVQAVYQFVPRWRVGLRYDQLDSDNQFSNVSFTGFGSADDLIEESGWADEDVKPARSTIMFDYSNSEFSRLRLQYSTEDSRHPGEEKDQQIFLQYVYSLGSHGAHRF